ncbi:UDP-glycosyltransferase 83A1-like [Papaver somniferum]|uniref:UDP-glycosyltransferase 83A1-like n=1 Tax=Papaver somniferum TaxID=3469 RepID=UPI000E6FE586|nr:UDP-glycosyltransferase 83A1-like [Papaver somniferum]
MKKIHALVLPFPAQGHVIPLMKLSNYLSEHGFKITFVNTDSNHETVVASLPKQSNSKENGIRLVSIPDGRDPGANERDFAHLLDSISASMPNYLEVLIREINESSDDDDKITCVIADENMGWAVKVAKKMKIPAAAFWTASVWLRTVHLHLEQMIETGILDSEEGVPTQQQMMQFSPDMPAMNTDLFPWTLTGDSILQKSFFRSIRSNTQDIRDANWFLCNSVYELEKPNFPLNKNLLPVGPLLLAADQQAQLSGNFLAEDSTCLSWLDQQPARSVIYLAFGSSTILDKHQFHEIALGLEHTGQPFLWAVRPNLTDIDAYPDGFQARLANRSRIVGWAPQQKVLAHKSIACFVTHCGWNSTMEGVAMGVPFLCWPYFVDQFLNRSYICDIWKVGLQLNKNEGGIIPKEEFINKVKALLADEMIRARALELQDISNKSVVEGGTSMTNLTNFIESIKCKLKKP